MSVWDKYKKIETIGYGTYGNIYKCKNKKTKNYVAIKEILKKKSNGKYLSEIEIMKKMKNENSILFKEKFETEEYIYIVMELCLCNLEEYIKMKENGLSINEIKHILNQLNKTFKIMLKENIILKNLKSNNILISLDKLDENIIKLSNYGSSKEIDNISEIPLTIAPEILKDEKNLLKCDLWSIGIIIYYMYFKEYPFNGKNKNSLLKDINSGKELKSIGDKKLNDLMTKLLKINTNDRISWNDYFEHKFFKEEPSFIFKCKEHSQNLISYCINCKLNICKDCLSKHNTHETIPFDTVGLNNEEIKQIEILFKDIEKRINIFTELKK